MLILVIALVLAPLAWLAIRRRQRGGPADYGASWRWVLAAFVAALVLRIALSAPLALRIALPLLVIGALVVWLRRRGHGGGGGDDGHDPPVGPDPDPGPGQRAVPPTERLDPEAFDRARAEWEHAMKPHAPD